MMTSVPQQIATSAPVTVSLAPDQSAPAAARALVAEVACDLPVPIPQKLSLVVSELVTNALRHSDVADPDPQLTIYVTPSRVIVAVHNRGLGFDRAALRRNAGTDGGWGLKLVDSLVDRWDVSHGVDGTRVICEIDRR